MSDYILRMRLERDATFGRGDGVAGLVDAEVEHDECGLPYLRGRALKGLLAEECANILYALGAQGESWHTVADCLFGKAGSKLEDEAKMRVGDAILPSDLRTAVRAALDDASTKLRPLEVLESLTAIRRQTAMTVEGAPDQNSLRSMRVVLRDTVFDSHLSFDFDLDGTKELCLLAACAASLRRVGLGRNRGRGRVVVSLIRRNDAETGKEYDVTADYLLRFKSALNAKEG